jgi:hypothetical protein
MAQAPLSPAPALASKSSTRRRNVFIASPGFFSLLADRPLPALLPLPVALFLFPLPLLSSLLSTSSNITQNITMVGTRKRRAEESEEEELQSLPEDSEEEEE